MTRPLRLLGVLAFAAACDSARPPPTVAPQVQSVEASATESAPEASLAPPPPPPADAGDGGADLAAASNALGFDLWRRVAGTGGNTAMSPVSISLALSMPWSGARGATRAELGALLHASGDADAVGAEWGRIVAALTDPSRPGSLRIASQLFGQTGVPFDASFVEGMRARFGAPLVPVDFRASAEASRATINAWVDERTAHHVPAILPPGSVDRQTRLVLVDAIAFLADWAEPFVASLTRTEPFFTSPGRSRPAPMMHKAGRQRAGALPGLQVLALPYAGHHLDMLVVIPDAVDGLAAIEGSLSAQTLASWRAALSERPVDIRLPRFELASPAVDLAPALSALGGTHLFGPTADFTGIWDPPSPGDRISLRGVFHQAFVKVDEKGTVAAAATAVVMPVAMLRAREEPPLKIWADRPFLVLVEDPRSGLVLFVGRVAVPASG